MRRHDDAASYDAGRCGRALVTAPVPPPGVRAALIGTPATPQTEWQWHSHEILARRRLPHLRLEAEPPDRHVFPPPGSLEAPVAASASASPLPTSLDAERQRAASCDESAAALLAESPTTAAPQAEAEVDGGARSAAARARVGVAPGRAHGGLGWGGRLRGGVPSPAAPPVDPVTRRTPPVFLRRGVPLFQVGATPKGGGGGTGDGMALHVQAATSFMPSPAHGLAGLRTPPAHAAGEGWGGARW